MQGNDVIPTALLLGKRHSFQATPCALARVAADANIPFTLATIAVTSLEIIARDVGGRLWFQLSMVADRSIADASHTDRGARAPAAG